MITKSISDQTDITLMYEGQPVAILSNIEIFPHRKEERVARQFGTVDRRHPTVDMIMASGDWLVGGDLQVGVKKLLMSFVPFVV